GPPIKVTEIANGTEWVKTELLYMNFNLEVDDDKATVEGMEKAHIAYERLRRAARELSRALIRDFHLTFNLRQRISLDELTSLKSLYSLVLRSDKIAAHTG
ncbi:hypothetical protein BX616_005012, partial [Lobosporangium transversale]